MINGLAHANYRNYHSIRLARSARETGCSRNSFLVLLIFEDQILKIYGAFDVNVTSTPFLHLQPPEVRAVLEECDTGITACGC